MIYVVTGVQRSGTSMMMACLKAGGMPLYFDESAEDALRNRHPDTNPGGFYEHTIAAMNEIDFPLGAEGKVVKFHGPWRLLGTMAPAAYRIVIMRRDPREIALSVAKMNNGMLATGDLAIFNRYYDYIDKAVALARNRRDVVSVTVADYDVVLSHPFAFFESLDWPLDAKAAAAIVDPGERDMGPFDTEFSGDIAKDLGMGEAMSISDAIADGKLTADPETVAAAKRGAKFELSAQ